MKILKLIKLLVVLFVALAGINIYFSALAAQANDEKSHAYNTRRALSLAGHELRRTSLILTRSVRVYLVMGTEQQLEIYLRTLPATDPLVVQQAFMEKGASFFEQYLLDRALAYHQRFRAMEALAIQARINGEYQLALNIAHSPAYTAYATAFTVLLDEFEAVQFARTQEMVENAENDAFLFQRLALIATILVGLISVFAIVFMLHRVKAAMQKAREANELNEFFINASPHMINIWDDAGKLVSTSNQAMKMFGLSSKEQFIERFPDLSPRYQPCGTLSEEKVKIYMNRIFTESCITHEWMHQTLSGEPLPVEVTLVRFERHGRQMVVAYVTDMRAIKAAIEKEREAHEMNEIILNSAPFVMNIWDDSFKLVATSQQAVEMFGLSSQEQYIERFFDLSPAQQPNGAHSREKALDCVKEAFRDDRRLQFEWMHQTLNGEPVPTEITLVRFKRQGNYLLASYTMDLRPVKQENERMLAEMRRREMAEEENLAKTRFLARMSHEIRTPMNAVLGIAEIQLQKEGHPPETEEAFLRIQSSSSLLLTIINDILDLSKVEAGKMEIRPETYELASMIVDTVQLNIMRVGSKSIEFKLNVDEQLPSHLIGDELRIKQILNNILSNAFKYTQEGSVTLSVGMEDTRQTTGSIVLVLRVQDTGQGMTGDQLGNLFAIEFTRFNLSSNRFIEGSGLGMTIAHQLTCMMEGDIKAESEEGRGSVFTVRIPQKPASNNTLGKETAKNLQNFEVSQKSLKKMSKLAAIPMPYGRVLVVDDVESNLYVIKGFLRPYKITVETVTNGYTATEKIRNGEVYDIIFMDHMMPGMDGIEATKIIRGMGYEHPIVALTANALKNVSEMFLNNGFSGFIPKPIDLDHFNSCLLRFIRDKQPPEVIEAAARQHVGAEGTDDLLDNLRESFLLDAWRALGILEPLIAPLTGGHELDEEGAKSFVIQAHSMKSALYNIGQAELSKAAFALEMAGRAGNMEAIRTSAPRFLDSLTELIKELSPKNTDHDADDEDMDFLKAQFDIIAQACEQLDPDTANAALDMLNQKQCSSGTKERIKNISANLLYGDFDEAAALATQAAGTLRTKQEP